MFLTCPWHVFLLKWNKATARTCLYGHELPSLFSPDVTDWHYGSCWEDYHEMSPFMITCVTSDVRSGADLTAWTPSCSSLSSDACPSHTVCRSVIMHITITTLDVCESYFQQMHDIVHCHWGQSFCGWTALTSRRRAAVTHTGTVGRSHISMRCW